MAWRFHNDSIEAGAIEIATQFKNYSSFGAGEFSNGIPVSLSEFTLRSEIFTAAARRFVGLLPSGMKQVPADVCLKCQFPLNHKCNAFSVCGSISLANDRSSWCTHSSNKLELHNAAAEVLCSM